MGRVETEISITNQGIQVIARAAAVLRTLKETGESLSLGQIAARVGLPRSTVQRIINALLAERLVMTAAPGSGYRLGPEIQSLATAGRMQITDVVRPYIVALARETGETVDLAEFRHDHMVFVDQIVGTHRLRTVAAVGEEFPLVYSANGKASLALLDDDTVARLAAQEMAASQLGHPRGHSDLNVFMLEIEQIRRQGYAYDLGEHTDGISAVGGAFTDAQGRIHAVSIPVPTHRFVKNQAALTEHLLRTLNRIRAIRGR